ncbi:MAG: tyrosine-type recombinase/integrase, partial [Deltaproteobacteria bacterium]|nr:tyrosine-type recombinase/integrase [Deltaproteobacteria bacterium]
MTQTIKKGGNQNHPEAGSATKVEPIRRIEDIKAIKRLLADKPRDLALFTVGINTNLRASDLLQITVGQVRGLKPMDEIELRERKTGKLRRISLNRACVEAINVWLAVRPKPKKMEDEDILFTGQRGPLEVGTVHKLVKSWCKAINLKGNYGSHSLRKSFGYHQRVTFGVGLPELMTIFNHSTQRQTLAYLCVQPDEV